MKKNKAMAYIIWAIAFVLFHVIAFVIPSAKTVAFYIAYAFSVIAFVSQIVTWKIAFRGANTLKSKFLGIPIVFVGITYFILQVISFAVFMALPTAPAWVAVAVCTLILGVSAICLIGTECGRDEINHIEKKVGNKVLYIQSLRTEVETLASEETDADTKTALVELADKICFSDPMSNEALADLETEISDQVEKLKTAENKMDTIALLNTLITKRNQKAKILK